MRQEEIILRHLREVVTISSEAAKELYRIQDLPKRISVLRREGQDIRRKLVRDQHGRRHALYFLAENAWALEVAEIMAQRLGVEVLDRDAGDHTW